MSLAEDDQKEERERENDQTALNTVERKPNEKIFVEYLRDLDRLVIIRDKIK